MIRSILSLILTTFWLSQMSAASSADAGTSNVAVKDGFLASILKKHPSRLQKTVFIGEPFLCANGTQRLLDDGNISGNALELKFVADSSNDSYSAIRSSLEKELNAGLSKISERADVGDRLLVIDATFVIGTDGKISNLKLSELCPGDFHSIILKATGPIQVSPSKNQENIVMSGRFVQNYGTRFIEAKGKEPGS